MLPASLHRPALVLPLLLAGCGPAPDAGKAAAPIPVSAFMVGAASDGSAGPVSDSAGAGSAADSGPAFAAVVRRDREATLSFRVGGTLAAVPVRIGQQLGAGALIAAIDATPYRANVARQAAEVARLERAAGRYAGLVAAGAVADAQARDAGDALAGARAGLVAARYDLAGTRVVMPFRGVVLARQVEQGETVSPGQVVATVADLGAPLLATAQVTADVAARLRPGLPVTIDAAGQGTLAGRVLRIAGGSDPRSGTVAVDVTLPAGTGLASGAPVAVRFAPAATAPGAAGRAAPVAIPAEALLEAQGRRASVFVIDSGGRARRRAVQFEGFADQSARVSGLPAGTRIITAGAGFVADGDAVVVAGTGA